MLTSVPGFKVGHFTDSRDMTGCTVILCPPETRGSCEVRGASPGSRELALLAPDKKMSEVHAVLLTGGSAFGLAAADGVMKWLEEHDIGYATPWGRVPIVPAAVIFDLNIGRNSGRPDSKGGYRACVDASAGAMEEGNVGAGTGATIGKWDGMEFRMKGGVGSASMKEGKLIVGALAVVNAVGDVLDEKGDVLAGSRDEAGRFRVAAGRRRMLAQGAVFEQTNTTLVVAATNAEMDKISLHRICQRMHDGFARAIAPVHSSYDGDTAFALSNGRVKADLDVIAEMAIAATSESIRRGVRAARIAGGVPGLGG
ncbi:MAG TPA: P1 family peptidase [Bacteroidota bacterium]|nr:P1 family peptidase [Bacteroidota bacterium]